MLDTEPRFWQQDFDPKTLPVIPSGKAVSFCIDGSVVSSFDVPSEAVVRRVYVVYQYLPSPPVVPEVDPLVAQLQKHLDGYDLSELDPELLSTICFAIRCVMDEQDEKNGG